MANLDGKVAIITGAARGIGRAIAQRLAQDGATIVINYGRSAEAAEDLVSGIESNGGKALAIQADMSQVADIRRLFEATIDRFGQLDTWSTMPVLPTVARSQKSLKKILMQYLLSMSGEFSLPCKKQRDG